MDTKERILAAAREIFAEKGCAGARMHEIGGRAEVNKAMLHYYFGNKDSLYETVILSAVQNLFEKVRPMLNSSDLSTGERIRRFIDIYADFLTGKPELPRLVVQDIVSGGRVFPRTFLKAQQQTGLVGVKPFLDLIRQGSAGGEIRPVDPQQTLVSIIGMTVFYFIAWPALDHILLQDEEEREAFVRNSLLPRTASDEAAIPQRSQQCEDSTS